ncbi:hypothetical protein V496_03062 [Pseudogymnoascus sp. VKM F-4515 (FW-2607)]|nr:hypothetical protein V496_03062 [Pseudogymnoascus sp. VKM F-4515 (FW-2607)]
MSQSTNGAGMTRVRCDGVKKARIIENNITRKTLSFLIILTFLKLHISETLCLLEVYKLSGRFVTTYQLLSRWQNNLEFFLFAFCRTNNQQIITKCNWPCYEAAELTRLSEEITEHCFHHKEDFRKSGISPKEREAFCVKLQDIRQIRNTVAHHEAVSASTIRQYAKSTLGVLKIVRQLGGKRFEKAYGKPLDQLLDSFWEVESNKEAVLPLDPLKLCYGREITESLLADVKTTNDTKPVMEQISGTRRRAINIETMIESFQAAEDKRAANQQLELRKKEAAAEKRAANQRLNLQNKEAAEERRAANKQLNVQNKKAAEEKRAANEQLNLQRKEDADKKRAANEQLNLQNKEAAEEKRAANHQQLNLQNKEAAEAKELLTSGSSSTKRVEAKRKRKERREQNTSRSELKKKEIK